jgi:hypothetical protein
MRSAKSSTEVATTDPLLVNHTGQDVEYRLSGGDAKTWLDWTRLPKGARMPIAAPAQQCMLEIRIILTQPIEGPLTSIEVTRSLKVNCKKRGEPASPKAPSQKSIPTKPAGTRRANRTQRTAEEPSDRRGHAAS